MLVKTKIATKNIVSKIKNTRISNHNTEHNAEVNSKSDLKNLFKYFTVNVPEVLIGKADAKAIESGKKEIENGDYLSLDELVLKIKSN